MWETMKGLAQWNPIYDRKDPRLKRGSNPGPLDKQTRAKSTELSGLLRDGWMDDCVFSSFSTVFKSYQDDVWVIMKGCGQWNTVYD